MKGNKRYIENVELYFVKIYSKAVKTGKITLKEFMGLNRRWDRAYKQKKGGKQ